MSPSFAPKERRRKRETRSPSERKSADDFVKDIEREYREEMRKRGLVDNWGQPIEKLDRKRLKQDVQKELDKEDKREKQASKKKAKRSLSKSMAASLSEAIGKRFREGESKRESIHKPSESEEKPPARKEKSSRPKYFVEKPKEGYDDRRRLKKYRVKMYAPEIRGNRFKSEDSLAKYIDRELSGMKHQPNFAKIERDAMAHMRLFKETKGIKTLTFPEIRAIAKKHDVQLWSVRKWICESSPPKLYQLAEKAIIISEAKLILDRLHEKRNGIDCIQDANMRFSRYYFGNDVKKLPTYNRDVDTLRKYFRYLDFLAEGGVQSDIARRAGISRLTGVKWTEGVLPHLLKRASEIPSSKPRDGWFWLPLKINKKLERSGFVQVPKEVASWDDVQKVIGQMQSLEGGKMIQWHSQFGVIGKEDAFMHALGVILSDGHLSRQKIFSTRMTLPLSKKYGWSHNLGEIVCYELGLVGIGAKRVKDWEASNNEIQERGKSRVITGPGFYVWESQHNRLLTWMRRSCLGFSDSDIKTYDPVRAEWLLKAPKRVKVAFLQGVCDGDGHVSVNAQSIGIATKSNKVFFNELLNSLGIASLKRQHGVLIKQKDSILEANELPLFKYSVSRLESLRELASIVIACKTKSPGMRVSTPEVDYACGLRKQGLSYGAISRSVFRKFGTSWDVTTIEHAIKKRTQAKSSRS